MPITSKRELFDRELRKLYHAEIEILDLHSDLAAAAASDEVTAIFGGHEGDTVDQIDRIEGIFTTLDMETREQGSPIMEGLIAEKDQFVLEIEDDELRDLDVINIGMINERLEITLLDRLILLADELGLPSGAAELADRHSVPYYFHPKDALAIDATPLKDGKTVTVGRLDIEVIHTPGHSEGSVSFDIDGAALITGDTLFHESVGRVELGVEAGIEDSDVERNATTLYESLQRLLDRPDDTLVRPAHDPGSPEPPVTATLAEVKERNEDLGRDREEFVQELASDIPDHPPNFERVKRTNVGQESVPADELAELELGPNNCAAE